MVYVFMFFFEQKAAYEMRISDWSSDVCSSDLNIFLSNSYTWSRKLREMVLALALEWKFSKDQILELYLNKVYFGGGSYGIDAASRRFFGKIGRASCRESVCQSV